MGFLKKSALLSSGQVLVVIGNVMGTMILARALKADMGQYDLFRNVAVLSMVVAAMGVGNANVYVLNGRGASLRQLVGNTLMTLLAVGTPLAVGIVVAIPLCGGYFGHVSEFVPVCFGVGVVALLGTALLRSILVAQLAVGRMLAVDLAAPGLVLGGAVVLSWTGRLTAQSALLVYSAGNVASFGVLVAFLWPSLSLRVRFDLGLLRLVLSQGVRFFAANASQVLGGTLTVMLLRYLTLGEDDFGPVALFTRATALCGLVALVPGVLGPLLYARWSGVGGKNRIGEVELAARLVVGYGLVATVVLALGGKYFLWALYGAAFIPAQVAVYALAPAAGVHVLLNVYENLFASDGRAGLTAWIFAGTSLVTVAATYLFVPVWGIAGAATAVLVAQAAGVVAATTIVRRRYGVTLARCVLVRREDVRWLRERLGWRRIVAPSESVATCPRAGS